MRTSALGKNACSITTLAIVVCLGVIPVLGQSEGQALHIFVGKSVVINVQTPVTRILSSNPSVIETIATSPTQVVVEGKAAGASSLILWDTSGHSQILDVTVDVNVASLRTAIEQTFPNQAITIQGDGSHLILTGTVSDPKVVEDVGKMAASYSSGVVNSLTVAPIHEQQILLEVKFAEVDRTKLQQLGFNIFSTGATNTIGAISTQQFSPAQLSTNSSNSSGGNSVANSSVTLSDLSISLLSVRTSI